MLHSIRTLTLVLALLFSGFALAGTVNINTADATVLAESLDGIGASKANAIVEYREKNGDFESLQDLLQVKGIGEMTLERNKDKIIFKANSKAK
jgi:competence protein ComEA